MLLSPPGAMPTPLLAKAEVARDGPMTEVGSSSCTSACTVPCMAWSTASGTWDMGSSSEEIETSQTVTA